MRRSAYASEAYWGRPVPGFGDPQARILIVGLAPGAHGSNRTGRMFTGDASGDFLYPALHRAGLVSAPVSKGRDDGLRAIGCYITAIARCVPPGNKLAPAEIAACRPFLRDEIVALPHIRVCLALGRVAHDGVLRTLKSMGESVSPVSHPFGHGASHGLSNGWTLIDSYHVSFQNTNTGKLTTAMFDAVLRRCIRLAGDPI